MISAALYERTRVAYSGIIDANIQSAVLVFDLLEQAQYLVFVSYITTNGKYFTGTFRPGQFISEFLYAIISNNYCKLYLIIKSTYMRLIVKCVCKHVAHTVINKIAVFLLLSSRC